MPGENAADAGLSWQEEIKREKLEILDQLHEEIVSRTQKIKHINAKFGFLTTMDFLDPANDADIVEMVHILTDVYDEIIARDLEKEIRRLR